MNFKKIVVFFKRNFTTTIIVAILAFLFCASFGSSLLETWKLYSYKQDLIHQIEDGREKSSQLDEDIKQIGSQEYIERIARQYLELYYPNEQIVIPVENNLPKDKAEGNPEVPAENQEDPTVQVEEAPQETAPEGTETEPAPEVQSEPEETPAEQESAPEAQSTTAEQQEQTIEE